MQYLVRFLVLQSERACCFTLFVFCFHVAVSVYVSLPHVGVGWSAVIVAFSGHTHLLSDHGIALELNGHVK